MAGFTITITDNLGNVIERIESAITGCSDFTPLWASLRRPWEESRETMYETQGRSTGSPWLGYEQTDEAEWYVWWKAAVTDQVIESPEDLNHLILRWTKNERLYPSLTNTRSLMALIATTVFHYKTTGQVPASTAFAFTRIRVQLFMDAHADKIMAPPL